MPASQPSAPRRRSPRPAPGTISAEYRQRQVANSAYALGQPLPVNQVGTGRNAFAHESGIHADVRLCNAVTGRPLTGDELRLIATCPGELSLMFPTLVE